MSEENLITNYNEACGYMSKFHKALVEIKEVNDSDSSDVIKQYNISLIIIRAGIGGK